MDHPLNISNQKPIDYWARWQRWTSGSIALVRFERQAQMVQRVQALGRLDCDLIAEDHRLLALTEEARATDDEIVRFSDQLTMSYLWVLGSYELVRTLDKRIRAQPELLPRDNLRDAVARLKQKFTRLRVPLAKMEPSSRFSDVDDGIAYPAISPDHGIAWSTAPGVFVTRRELSDEWLALLEVLRSVDLAFKT